MAEGPTLKLVSPPPPREKRARSSVPRAGARTRRVVSVGAARAASARASSPPTSASSWPGAGSGWCWWTPTWAAPTCTPRSGIELPRRTLSDFIERRVERIEDVVTPDRHRRTSAWSPARSTTSTPPTRATPRRCGCCATSRPGRGLRHPRPRRGNPHQRPRLLPGLRPRRAGAGARADRGGERLPLRQGGLLAADAQRGPGVRLRPALRSMLATAHLQEPGGARRHRGRARPGGRGQTLTRQLAELPPAPRREPGAHRRRTPRSATRWWPPGGSTSGWRWTTSGPSTTTTTCGARSGARRPLLLESAGLARRPGLRAHRGRAARPRPSPPRRGGSDEVKRLADQTLYEILEVRTDAAPEEIAQAYERARAIYGPGLARHLHAGGARGGGGLHAAHRGGPVGAARPRGAGPLRRRARARAARRPTPARRRLRPYLPSSRRRGRAPTGATRRGPSVAGRDRAAGGRATRRRAPARVPPPATPPARPRLPLRPAQAAAAIPAAAAEPGPRPPSRAPAEAERRAAARRAPPRAPPRFASGFSVPEGAPGPARCCAGSARARGLTLHADRRAHQGHPPPHREHRGRPVRDAARRRCTCAAS